MRYVTSIERLAKEEGIEQGMLQNLQENVIKILQTRFGVAPERVVEVINGIEDQSLLRTLFTNAITVSSTEEFQQLFNESKSEGES